MSVHISANIIYCVAGQGGTSYKYKEQRIAAHKPKARVNK